jgi:hypothetical protein
LGHGQHWAWGFIVSDISSQDQFPSSSGDSTFGNVKQQYTLLGKGDDDEYKAQSRPRLGQPIQGDLSATRQGAPARPSPEREAALIIAAQAGDDTAATELLKAYLPSLRWRARKRWLYLNPHYDTDLDRAVTYADFVGAVIEAWWRSVMRWRPGNGLEAFASRAVNGAISDVAHDFRNWAALKMASRAQRFLRANFDNAEQGLPDLSPAEIEIEKNAAFPWRPNRYSEVSNADDDGEYDPNGDRDGFKGSGETTFDLLLSDYTGGPVSEWSRSSSYHNPIERFFSDGLLIKPEALFGWDRRKRDERLAPLIRVDDQVPPKIRHLGSPLGPAQDARNSTWDMASPNKLLRAMRSLRPTQSNFRKKAA